MTGSSHLSHCIENQTNTQRETKQGVESRTGLSNLIWALIPLGPKVASDSRTLEHASHMTQEVLCHELV